MSDFTHDFQHLTAGRYQIEARLGSGGMARVYKAQDINLGRTVAIKVLHEHLADDMLFQERFEREARLVAQLNHPNIVQVYDFSSITRGDQCSYYMVMSFIDGPTLKDRLQAVAQAGQPLPHDEVQRLMLNLTDALGYAHERGMIHRDVKPANILINPDGQAVLTDFGIARIAQSSGLTQEGFTVGTPTYMSPEQATGEPIDARADLYSLGVILYEMLAGRAPFGDDGTVSVLIKHLNALIPSLPFDNPPLNAVVRKALAKMPEDRFQTAAQFSAALKAAFMGKLPESLGTTTRPMVSTRGMLENALTEDAPTTVLPATRRFAMLQRPNPQSPLFLLVAGLMIIVAFGIIGVISRQNNRAAAPTTPDSLIFAESMTGDQVEPFFASTFDSEDTTLDYWAQDSMNGLTRGVTDDGFYRLSFQIANLAVATPFGSVYAYRDQAVQMVAQLQPDSAVESGYGIVFRYLDQDNYNVFAVDGMGRYSLWTRENGVWRELRDAAEQWTPNEAIAPAGTMNTLTLGVTGTEFVGYVNGQEVVRVQDDTFATGGVGIYLATPEDGAAEVLIDMYQVMEALPDFAASMTGN
jgi:serine/threonine protein kinase